MFRVPHNSLSLKLPALLLLLAAGCTFPLIARAGSKKKKTDATASAVVGPRKFNFDPKKLVWPSPPNIARVQWLDYFAGAKIDYSQQDTAKPKASWMDRLAGGQSQEEKV